MSTTFQHNFARITAGQTVSDIVAATGIDQGSVSRYLTGKRVPKVPRLLRIASTYEVDVDELLRPIEDAA